MSTNTVPTGVTVASASEQLDTFTVDVLTAADATAADSIQNLSLVHQARLSRLTRTAATAVAQYGAGSTQATAAHAAAAATKTVVARVNMIHQQVTTPVLQVAAKGWALHGRVYDSKLNPLPKHSVFLVNSERNYQSAYGFAYTDSSGYFVMNYAGAAAAKADTTPKTAAAAELYLQIANTKAKPVYLSTTAFQPAAGSTTYQTVTLPAGEPALGDLPAEVRAAALPPLDEKKKR